MEKILKKIFDFQRFSPNKKLSKIISDVENRYHVLNDEELSLISAAGNTDITNDLLEKKDEHTDKNI